MLEVSKPMVWSPASDMQKMSLDSEAEFLCMGGSAGTYKTESLLIDPTQQLHQPGFHGIIIRSTFPELEKKIIPRSRELYSGRGGIYDHQQHAWRFPLYGSMIRFAYLTRDDDVYAHQGAEYSYIGFDESTHRSEHQIRYLISRLRSTNPFIKLKVRCGTNPGGPGHALHMHVFLGDACPHCERGGREPGRMYKDATWLSDKKLIEKSTQYIFGKWDKDGYLPDYDKQLRTQGMAFSKQLLEGCWRSFEGQYFDIWEPYRQGAPMVVPRQSIKDDWFWTFWVGCDYGFSGSHAFSVLCARSPDGGPIYVLDEYPHDLSEGRRQDVKTFSKHTYEALIKKPARYEQPPRLVGMYLSPDCWANRGDEHTLASLMNEVIAEYEIEWEHAHNDRAGGAMLIYTMLQQGELVIADTCRNVIRAIESRVHDKKEPEKIEKKLGDPYDDVGDSLRYAIYSYHQAQAKPYDMRVADKLKKAIAIDPTRAVVDYQKILREEQNEDEPQPYSQHGGRMRRQSMMERARRPNR